MLKKKVLFQYTVILIILLAIATSDFLYFMNKLDDLMGRLCIYFSNQLYITLFFLLEPFLKHQIWLFVTSQNKDSPNYKTKFHYSSDSLDSFINSAINYEYVYLILTGVNRSMYLM